jgi:hypothetical protein
MVGSHFYQLIDPELPASILPFPAAIRAECAVIYTDIGGFEVYIPVEKNLFAVDPVPDMFGQNCQIGQCAFTVEKNALFSGDTLTGSDLFSNPDHFG